MLNLSIAIPLAISPLERGDRFEFPICDLFEERGEGRIIGSGSFRDSNGIQCCDIQLHIPDRGMIRELVRILVDGGAPGDTTLTCYNVEDGSNETVEVLAELDDANSNHEHE